MIAVLIPHAMIEWRFFNVLSASLVWMIATVAAAPADEPGNIDVSCPSDTRRVTDSDLLFCWSMARTAAGFRFTDPELLQGHQWWLRGRRIAEDDLEELSEEQKKPAVLATFVIIPADHPLIKSRWATLGRSWKIEAAIKALAPDGTDFSIILNQGEEFGDQSFDFHKAGPTLFSAQKQLAPRSGPVEQVEYWVSINDAGNADYVMSCVRLERVQSCASWFTLSQNLVSVSISLGADAASARAAFEDLRAQIRSYLVSPDRDAE